MSNIVFEGFHINKVFNGIINDEDLDALEKEVDSLIDEAIKKLEENGFILPEDVIKLSKFKVLDLLDSEEEAYERRKRDSEIHIW